MSLTRLSSFSLTMASVCTSSSSEEPPWRSSPSTIRFFGMKPGRPSSVAWETKFGITSSSPTRQTPKIRTDLHRGVRIVGLPLEEALQPGADVVAQPAEPAGRRRPARAGDAVVVGRLLTQHLGDGGARPPDLPVGCYLDDHRLVPGLDLGDLAED